MRRCQAESVGERRGSEPVWNLGKGQIQGLRVDAVERNEETPLIFDVGVWPFEVGA